MLKVIDNSSRNLCTGCLSVDRDLYSLDNKPHVNEIYRLIMQDFKGQMLPSTLKLGQLVCWECLIMLKKFFRFKKQVQKAHASIILLNTQRELFKLPSKSLSCLRGMVKIGYDHMFVDERPLKTEREQSPQKSNVEGNPNTLSAQFNGSLYSGINKTDKGIDNKVKKTTNKETEISAMEDYDLENPETGIASHIIVSMDKLRSQTALMGESKTPQGTFPKLVIEPISRVNSVNSFKVTIQPEKDIQPSILKNIIDVPQTLMSNNLYPFDLKSLLAQPSQNDRLLANLNLPINVADSPLKPTSAPAGVTFGSNTKETKTFKIGYKLKYFTDMEIMASREKSLAHPDFVNAKYKCISCILIFHSSKSVAEHLEAHGPKFGHIACRFCNIYLRKDVMAKHMDMHHMRYECQNCSHSVDSIMKIKTHVLKCPNRDITLVEDSNATPDVSVVNTTNLLQEATQIEDNELQEKSTVECLKCPKCDMFFKNLEDRDDHMTVFHRYKMECNYCRKKFAYKGSLVNHIRQHEGRRRECPACHKMVKELRLVRHMKYNCAKRKDNKKRRTRGVKSATIKRSNPSTKPLLTRKKPVIINTFTCPECDQSFKIYQKFSQHIKYEHPYKAYKLPDLDEPSPKQDQVKKGNEVNHACKQCDLAFENKNDLLEHSKVHAADTPLVCEICHANFKFVHSLHAHRKEVHNMHPVKWSTQELE